MSTSFAGSRSLDERRRRRLAADSEQTDFGSDGQGEPNSSSSSGPRSQDRLTAPRLPVRKLISPKLWKLWSVGGAALALAVGILAAGLTVEADGRLFGPGFVRLFALTSDAPFRARLRENPSGTGILLGREAGKSALLVDEFQLRDDAARLPAGRAVTWYASLLLMLTGQLAWLIWWVRSRSLQDFAGRYRIWTRVAVAAFGFAALAATGAHRALSETVDWLWPVEFWNKDVLCWLVPAGSVVLVLLRPLYREMRQCRSSLGLLWLSGAGWMVACLIMLLRTPEPVGLAFLSVGGTDCLPYLQSGAVLFGCVCLFESFLLHCRHVIYVTAEPPEIRPTRLTIPRLASVLRYVSVSRWRSGFFPGASGEQPETEDAPEPPAAINEPPFAEQSDSAAGGKQAAGRSSGNRRKSARKTAESRPYVENSPGPPVKQVDQPHQSAGKPPDPEMLKGLSKKQRRKLRKQWREQQRATRNG